MLLTDEQIRKALDESGRDIVLSLSNAAPYEHVEELGKLANLWRTTGDIQDHWGSVSGIGAVGEVTLGVFNREKFAYESTTYTGDYEIASCSGTITTKEGETYLHIHMAVGNAVKDECHGGHLNRAVVSLTGEFVIQQLDGTVEREYSPEVGLNLFKFSE